MDIAIAGYFKVNPTVVTGDFKVDIDGGGFTNLGTTPTVSPAGGVAVLVTMAQAEMNGDVITVTGISTTSPKAWSDFSIVFLTTAAGVTLANPQGIKKNTALANVPFMMYDSTGTPKTGLQASLRTSGNCQISIDGGAFANLTNYATITEIANGWYWVSFAAADLNGNDIAVNLSATGAVSTTFTLKTVSP
jgi:hypothetical protein